MVALCSGTSVTMAIFIWLGAYAAMGSLPINTGA